MEQKGTQNKAHPEGYVYEYDFSLAALSLI